jgi:hypothetical protein
MNNPHRSRPQATSEGNAMHAAYLDALRKRCARDRRGSIVLPAGIVADVGEITAVLAAIEIATSDK